MANPKRRHTRSRRDMRRAQNWRLLPPTLGVCPQCGGAKSPHHVCPSCGYYRGELILPPKVKATPESKG